MGYLYETHLHTSPASACGASNGREHVRFYKSLGFQGIIVTDHFFGGNTGVPRDLPWKERINLFCAGYEEALDEGIRVGLDVFFGWEEGFCGDEYLIYGLDKTFMLEHPEMEHWTRKEQLETVHANGGCVVQAHPFRDRAYIARILLGERYADAAEVANTGNLPYNDVYAYAYAKSRGLVMTAGSDNHNSAKADPGMIMGIETEERLSSMADYSKLILSGKQPGLRVPEGRFDITGDEPQLKSYWLDENERYVPTGREWIGK